MHSTTQIVHFEPFVDIAHRNGFNRNLKLQHSKRRFFKFMASSVRLAISLGLLLGSLHGWYTSEANAHAGTPFGVKNVNYPGAFASFGSDSLNTFP